MEEREQTGGGGSGKGGGRGVSGGDGIVRASRALISFLGFGKGYKHTSGKSTNRI